MGMIALRPLAVCLALLMSLPGSRAADQPANGLPPHPAISLEGIDIPAAIEKERQAPAGTRITGIGTPHHLLAADLIARAFLTTRGGAYDRILVLSPDHFFKGTRPAATTLRSFDTPFGIVATDGAAATSLLQSQEVFAQSDLFDTEHGVTGLMPFVRLLHPEVPVVAVALGIGSTRQEWDAIADALKPIVTPRTLIVQSTDYSHYLLPAQARLHDQQTLKVLASGNLDALSSLRQPAHLDSRAANYIQMRLQREVFGASATVIANRTAFDYVKLVEPTTSYIVTAYSPDAVALGQLRYADQTIEYFAGDVFLGRHFTELVASSATRNFLVQTISAITRGAPLTVNLEGAMVEETPHGLPPQRHAMTTALALPFLRAINTRAAGLANNHSHDLGTVGFEETRKALGKAGIAALQHLKIEDMGAFRLVALNYIGAGDHKGYPVARPPKAGRASDIEAICKAGAKPPLIAFVHWGEEYRDAPSETEVAVASDLSRCGVAAIIGAHSHKASPHPLLTGGGDQITVFSVGNFLFDQFSATSSGAFVEVRVFERGTFAIRMLPIPNFYEAAIAARSREQ
jgi:poly-gamma-glutamate synthesis protein (capsule biosynthesis protein)